MTGKGTQQRAPWETISSRVVYKNKWMRVREDEYIQPDGKVGIYGVIEKDDYVVIIPIIDNTMYLVEQYRYPMKERSWEFPQGMGEGNEDLKQCATRELEEETGIVCNALTLLGKLWLAGGHHTQKFNVYAAEDCTKGKQQLEGSESDIIVKGYTIGEVEAMIQSGKIKDSPTVSAFYLYRLNVT